MRKSYAFDWRQFDIGILPRKALVINVHFGGIGTTAQSQHGTRYAARALGGLPLKTTLKTTLVVLSIVLLAGFASAGDVNFVGYAPYNTYPTVVSYQGLTFTGSGGFMSVRCCDS